MRLFVVGGPGGGGGGGGGVLKSATAIESLMRSLSNLDPRAS